MNPQQLSIATISWARDNDEEALLRQSLNELSSLDIPVFITDGGSPETFVKDLRKLNHFTVYSASAKGLWPQARTSLDHATNSGASFILYTEPDKTDFLKSLPQLLNDIKVNENTGVILASRTPSAMATFPTFQQMTETTINNCCAEVIGQAIDYTYGPFIMNRDIVASLQAIPDNIGWGWRPYAFNIAARLGLNISAHTGNYNCPADQQADDPKERIYRMKQLNQNIEGLVLSTAVSAT